MGYTGATSGTCQGMRVGAMLWIIGFAAAYAVLAGGLVALRPRPRFGNFVRRFGKVFLDEPDAIYFNAIVTVWRGRWLHITGTMPRARLLLLTVYTLRKRVVVDLSDRDLGLQPEGNYHIIVGPGAANFPNTASAAVPSGIYLILVRVYLSETAALAPQLRYSRRIAA